MTKLKDAAELLDTPVNKTQHTPGPWSAQWSIRDGYNRRKQWGVMPEDEDRAVSEGSICDLSDTEVYRGLSEVEANARLMAAAPDMLVALEGLLHIFDDHGSECTAAMKAIAKARGD